MTALIPSKLIDLAEAEGACSEAIAWLRERPRTFLDLADEHKFWIMWGTGLLSAPARKDYDEATAPAWKAYIEATATAQKAYNEAKATAWKDYDEAIAPALKAYDKATKPARKAYVEAIATAMESALRRSHPELFEEESCPNQNKP